MKRYLSLILCAVMLLGVFASCSTLKGDDKGMVLDVYMSTPIVDFDPALHFNDDALTKIFDMIYEGLTDLDENGKWTKALIKSYKYTKNKDGSGWTLLIKLNLGNQSVIDHFQKITVTDCLYLSLQKNGENKRIQQHNDRTDCNDVVD